MRGIERGLWGSAGSDTGGVQGGTHPVGTRLKASKTHDNSVSFTVQSKSFIFPLLIVNLSVKDVKMIGGAFFLRTREVNIQ